MRVGRIELPPRPWQGRVLPLNDTRKLKPKLKRQKAKFKTKCIIYYIPRFSKFCTLSFTFLISYGALGGIRTPNNSSEDWCDIHFTTEARSEKRMVYIIYSILFERSRLAVLRRAWNDYAALLHASIKQYYRKYTKI